MFYRDKLLALLFLFVVCSFFNCNRKQDNIIQKQLFDLNWKFSPGNITTAYQVDFNDQLWRNIDLPHDWSKDAELAKLSSENQAESMSSDIGWYRKHFTIPEDWTNKNILIDFEGLYDHYEIYVNGISISDSVKGNASFQKILNPYLNSKINNVIAIRVTIPKQKKDTWRTESGIYKHVWLVIKNSHDFNN